MSQAPTLRMDPMGKKKPAKATLYVDIDASLKKRMDRLAEVRHRKLNAEVSLALDRYLREEEPKEGLAEEDVED
jgi:predicted transcriptional regulator